MERKVARTAGTLPIFYVKSGKNSGRKIGAPNELHFDFQRQ
jgi:hypothetical protein